MFRILIGGVIGFLTGLLFLAAWGFYDGLTDGLQTAGIRPRN